MTAPDVQSLRLAVAGRVDSTFEASDLLSVLADLDARTASGEAATLAAARDVGLVRVADARPIPTTASR